MTNCRAAFSFAGGAPWPAAAMATDSVGQCIGRSRCLRGLRGRAAGEEGLHHENAMRPANVSFVPFRSLPDATPARLAVHRLNQCAPEAAEPFVLETWRKLFAEPLHGRFGLPDRGALRDDCDCGIQSCAELGEV